MKASETLKLKTKHLHDALEDTLNSKEIFADSFSPEKLGFILQVIYSFHLKFEESISSALQKSGSFPGLNFRSRISYLKKDLEAIGKKSDDSIVPEKTDILQFEALGWYYVIEGSSLGGNAIRKHLQKNPAFNNFPFHYYAAFSEGIGEFWKNFLEIIDSHPEQEDEIVKGAEQTYLQLIEIANHYKIQLEFGN